MELCKKTCPSHFPISHYEQRNDGSIARLQNISLRLPSSVEVDKSDRDPPRGLRKGWAAAGRAFEDPKLLGAKRNQHQSMCSATRACWLLTHRAP